MLSKKIIRQNIKQRLQQAILPTDFACMLESLTTIIAEQHAQEIACYMALPHEVNTAKLIQGLWEQKKNCYLPVMKEELLAFHSFQPSDFLTLNRFRILESSQLNKWIAPHALDLVILPMCGFDGRGFRLGTGGGYYDKTFQFKKNDRAKKLFLVGLAFATQFEPEIPIDPWDLQMDAVVTENGLYAF